MILATVTAVDCFIIQYLWFSVLLDDISALFFVQDSNQLLINLKGFFLSLL